MAKALIEKVKSNMNAKVPYEDWSATYQTIQLVSRLLATLLYYLLVSLTDSSSFLVLVVRTSIAIILTKSKKATTFVDAPSLTLGLFTSSL